MEMQTLLWIGVYLGLVGMLFIILAPAIHGLGQWWRR